MTGDIIVHCMLHLVGFIGSMAVKQTRLHPVSSLEKGSLNNLTPPVLRGELMSMLDR